MNRLQIFETTRGFILAREVNNNGRVSSNMSAHDKMYQGGIHSVHGSPEYVAGSPNVRKYSTLIEAIEARHSIEED